MSSHESLELSPGFFDPRFAVSDEEDEPIVPLLVDVENSDKDNVIYNGDTDENDQNNFVEDIVVFMFTAQKRGCGCSEGWKRTTTY